MAIDKTKKFADLAYEYIRRKLVKPSKSGITSLPTEKEITNEMLQMFEKLRGAGYNVTNIGKEVKNADDLGFLVNRIEQAEINQAKEFSDAAEALDTIQFKLNNNIPLNPDDQKKLLGKGFKTTSEAFRGFEPKVIQGGKKEGIEQLLKSGDVKKGVAPKTTKETIERKSMIDPKLTDEENIKNIMKENKAAAKRLEEKMKDPDKKAMGGRIGFKEGGMTRRTFLKLLGGLASIPFVGKFLKPAAKVAKTAEVAKSSGVPAYFPKLVEKIKLLGDDITPMAATQERQVVTKYKDYEMTEDLSSGAIEIEKTNTGMAVAGDEVYEGIKSKELIEFKPPETIMGKDGKPVKVPAQYEETTARPTNMEGDFEDFDDGLESIDEILEEVRMKKSGGGLAYMMGE